MSTTKAFHVEAPIEKIHPDPNQPRTYYDPVALEELSNSIKEKGVLSPVTVRELPDDHLSYMIIFGERRWRAAKLAGLETIPVIVRNVSDDEALQLQIVENLQRQDVHPMNEAVAFKSFQEQKKWSPEEIGRRVGKDARFVRARLQLNSLSKEWQKAFFANNFKLVTATKIAQLSKDGQKALLEKYDLSRFKPGEEVSISDHYFKQLQGKLSNAPFDIADATLVKKAGPCTGCNFNSAVTSLFGGEEANPICSNIACFNNKAEVAFQARIKQAQEDPDVLLYADLYVYGSSDSDNKVIAAYEKEFGKQVFHRNQVSRIHQPEKPNIADYEEEIGGQYDDREEMEADYKDDLKRYENDLREYNEGLTSGKFKTGLCIHGDGRGQYLLIKITKAASNSKTKTSAGNTATATTAGRIEEIKEEISGIKEREARAIKLDGNKEWANILPEFQTARDKKNTADLEWIERVALAALMYSKLDWQLKESFRKAFPKFNDDNPLESKFTPADFNAISRWFMFAEYPPKVLYNGHTEQTAVCMKLGEKYFPEKLLEITGEQAAKAEKRAARVAQRIAALEEEKKKLQSEARKAAKAETKPDSKTKKTNSKK